MIARRGKRGTRIGLLVAIGVLLGVALPVGATQATVTLAPGALPMTPTVISLAFDAPTNSTANRFVSSFTVVVTDARGNKGGWQVRGATASMTGPSGTVTPDSFAVIDFSVPTAQGTWPNPTCVCDAVSTTLATILQTPEQTGMGKATITLTTLFALPDDAPRGHYTIALILEVAPLGAVTSSPGGRGNPGANPGVPPNPAPSPPLSAGGVPPDATMPAVAPSRRLPPPTAGEPEAVTVAGSAAPAPAAERGSDPAPAAPRGGAANDRATTDAPSIPQPAPTGPAAPSAATDTSVTSPTSAGAGTDANARPAPPPATGAAQNRAAAPAATRSENGSQNPSPLPVGFAAPATVSPQAGTRDGGLTILRSSFSIGQNGALRDRWRLQATYQGPEEMQAAAEIALEIAEADSTPSRALTYTVPTLDPSLALLDYAIPASATPTTLLLTTRLLLDDATTAKRPPAALTITLVAGP